MIRNLPICNSEILECLEKILEERLTKKQKFILDFVKNHKIETVTKLVKIISNELKCSESCVWNNINSLKRCGLLVNGSGSVEISEIFSYF